MEIIYKINIRSTLRGMETGSVVEFPRDKYSSLSIRSTAAMLKEGEGKAYTVSAKDPDKVVVKRIN
jgi:hypothetical protein